MSYDYQAERSKLFTERGVDMLLKIFDNARQCLEVAGSVTTIGAWKGVGGNSFEMLAALDYLVERGELREITWEGVRGQDRVFVRG